MTSTTSLFTNRTPLVVDVLAAATLLGVAPVTVRRLLRAGVLPTVRIGAAVRIPIAAIQALATPTPVTFDGGGGDAAFGGVTEHPLDGAS